MMLDKNDIRICKKFVGKTARIENGEVFYRGAVDVKVLSVDENGLMVCQVKSVCCD